MFLEKLEIQGFKSFANKNILVFPGRARDAQCGITSIVGPNGSGKSNISDAVRWVLGEQSMKSLRGKKSEDVIFSGTEKKGKLGMAEVSLYLNNEERMVNRTEEVERLVGEEIKVPEMVAQSSDEEVKTKDKKIDVAQYLECSQIVITRRVYRSGESEYLINNSRTRLADIQILLAYANFGQRTYSVIGQGTVDGFLNTTLAERKEFFDEATGVKQFQLKRDESLNKLRLSYENLVQAQMLVTEIEPRLASLTRQVKKMQRRGELETALKEVQLGYYSFQWHYLNTNFTKYNSEFLTLEKEKNARDAKLEKLNADFEKFKLESADNGEFNQLQQSLASAQREKDDITKKLARIDAQIEMQLEAQGDFDVSFLLGKKESLGKDIEILQSEIEALTKSMEVERAIATDLQAERRQLDGQIELLNKELATIGATQSVKKEDKKISDEIAKIVERVRRLNEHDDLEKIKALLLEIEAELLAIIELSSGVKETKNEGPSIAWRQIHGQIGELAAKKEELMSRMNENNLKLSGKNERLRLLNERLASLGREKNEIEGKIKQNQTKIDFKDLGVQKESLLLIIEEKMQKIIELRERFNALNAEEQKKREQLFVYQKDIQTLQAEVNRLNAKLNDLKVNAARFEMRLEDLETEIRQDFGDLTVIKSTESSIDEAEATSLRGRIFDIKKQLEVIGGIDPQVEAEYNTAKERSDFLTGQINDFNNAIGSLEKIIKELDMAIRTRFDKEFKNIAENFEKYFKILFNGGTAKIIKLMSDEEEGEKVGEVTAEGAKPEAKTIGLADISKVKFLQKYNSGGLAGIEIQACPPGKKISSIAMLSGGERALTAIALISAIISANPSPFVFLDEVDASLDEANSERLAMILDDLSHKTQFIAITHNRAIMRRASILYGVTMGDDGVSKLLSVKLEEAEKSVRN